MKIIIDENAGFCFGVKKAVDKAFELLEKAPEKNIRTYGPLIHNNQVISKLEKQKVYATDDLDGLEEDDMLVLRSHGVPESIYKTLQDKNIEYIDCTCPFVAKIHKIVKEHYEQGYQIFIVGDKKHPEVVGINGWCNFSAVVLDNEKIVDKLAIYDKICLVAQTTIMKDLWESVEKAVIEKYQNVKVFNTRCSATEERQKSASELSGRVDTMIVIGSFESSNTNKLYEICRRNCENTIHIETAEALPLDLIKNSGIVGITAGASTPDWIIKEVILKMEEMTNQDQMNMMEEYEKSFKSLSTGEIVKGTVILVTDSEVMVNIGYKADGIVKKEDYTWEPEANLKELVKPGDELEVAVMSINDGEGNVVLSKKAVDAEKNWYKIEYAYNEKAPLEGVIREIVKGGAIAEIFGIRAFIPASQMDLQYTEDLTKFLNNKVKVNVIEYDKEKKKVVVSRKDFLKKEKEAAEKKVWETIEEGQRLTGEVKRLTDFGAFVDLGGVDGLIHISELSWTRVKHPSEVVKPGNKVEVIVLKLDREKKKISLGLKQTMPEPWSTIEGKYNVGDIIDVKVLRFSNFGAFVELEPGVDGLVHISQIADRRIAKPADALTIGETVKAKIMEIKAEEKKISLSIKEAQAGEQEQVQEEVKEKAPEQLQEQIQEETQE